MSEQPEPKAEAAPIIKELSGRIGKYDIVKPLGKGAMGMVYLAHDTLLERDVALKVMVSTIADDPELKHRFEREAKAVAKMSHPNVVNVFDLGNHVDGSPFIAMELLKGMDLQRAVRTPPPMPLERKVNIIIQVLAGLAHAHQAGIVHRDIKPANIFLNHDGTVKIMDFGVARLTTASMTGTGNIVGTADYMSPEQVKGAKVDGRSDLFSVGCMLYELLAGRRPFHSENLMAIFYKITHEEPNWELIPDSPEHAALMPILQKALAKNLEERYQTAYDFANELKEFLKANVGGDEAAHALEGLVEIEPPPSTPPQPITDFGPGPTLVGAEGEGETAVAAGTMDLGPTARGKAPTVVGRPGTGPRTLTPTRAGAAPTAVTPAAGATRVGPAAAPTVVRPTPAPRPMPPPAPPSNTMLYVVLGVMGVGIVGIGSYVVLKQQEQKPQVVNIIQTPPTTAAPPPTTEPAPPTTAPPPTLGEAVGRSAAVIRNAQAAFSQGDYDRAVTLAQQALRDDPGNTPAQKTLNNALEGQKAAVHFRTAEAALARNDLAGAEAALAQGRAIAPWDVRAPALAGRIQDARARAEQQQQTAALQQKQAQLTDLLNKADGALSGQQYEAAISLYDSVLGLDPSNQRAIMGKSSAVQARALSQAAAAGAATRPGGGKSFVVGKTSASAAEASAGNLPPGFEDSAGIAVKKGTQAAELPGKIGIEIDPGYVKPGDPYSVKISLLNEGGAPIDIKDMTVTTVVNGRRASGPLQPLASSVAPRQKALIFDLKGNIWKEDTSSWTMEVLVRTTRGETYKNQVTWR